MTRELRMVFTRRHLTQVAVTTAGGSNKPKRAKRARSCCAACRRAAVAAASHGSKRGESGTIALRGWPQKGRSQLCIGCLRECMIGVRCSCHGWGLVGPECKGRRTLKGKSNENNSVRHPATVERCDMEPLDPGVFHERQLAIRLGAKRPPQDGPGRMAEAHEDVVRMPANNVWRHRSGQLGFFQFRPLVLRLGQRALITRKGKRKEKQGTSNMKARKRNHIGKQR